MIAMKVKTAISCQNLHIHQSTQWRSNIQRQEQETTWMLMLDCFVNYWLQCQELTFQYGLKDKKKSYFNMINSSTK